MNDELINKLIKSPVEAAYMLRADLELFIEVFHWYVYKKQFIFKPFHKQIIRQLESLVYKSTISSKSSTCSLFSSLPLLAQLANA